MHVPFYPVAQVSRYVGVPSRVLRSWSSLKRLDDGDHRPLIEMSDSSQRLFSFSDMVEAHILKALWEIGGVKKLAVREALDKLASEVGRSRPLLDSDAYRADGILAFVSSIQDHAAIGRSRAWVLERRISDLSNRIEFKNGLASSLMPYIPFASNSKDVCINPGISFGQPFIVGTGAPTAVIAGRHNTGESMESLAKDYGCTVDQVKAAIMFEVRRRPVDC